MVHIRSPVIAYDGKRYLDLEGIMMNDKGFLIGIGGGIELGLLIGSELSGTMITLLGAGILVISLLLLGVYSYKDKNIKREEKTNMN